MWRLAFGLPGLDGTHPYTPTDMRTNWRRTTPYNPMATHIANCPECHHILDDLAADTTR